LGVDDEEDEDDEGFEAELDELPGMDDDEDGATRALYYSVDGSNLATGQRLMVEVSLAGDEGTRLVVPYSSLIYDIYGDTWVYTNPEPRHFLRVPVVVDYIQGENVVLVDGPAAGTTVVTIGVAELHGTDTGVGK
jgi:multidrug efflux pump subunit AcrA (membrane-fusion protein)